MEVTGNPIELGAGAYGVVLHEQFDMSGGLSNVDLLTCNVTHVLEIIGTNQTALLYMSDRKGDYSYR